MRSGPVVQPDTLEADYVLHAVGISRVSKSGRTMLHAGASYAALLVSRGIVSAHEITDAMGTLCERGVPARSRPSGRHGNDAVAPA